MTRPGLLATLCEGDAVIVETIDGARHEGVVVVAPVGTALVLAVADERERVSLDVEELAVVWRLS